MNANNVGFKMFFRWIYDEENVCYMLVTPQGYTTNSETATTRLSLTFLFSKYTLKSSLGSIDINATSFLSNQSRLNELSKLQVYEINGVLVFVRTFQLLFVNKLKPVALSEMHLIDKCTLIA